MAESSWVPANISTERPSAARIYDFLLGGSHNFEADRVAGEQLLRVNPGAGMAARANRYFLRRAVTFLVEQGIRQFLDIGSGIPTSGNVHEVAQHLQPESRIVYVDSDPVAVAHAEALLAGNPQVAALQADARDPEQILSHATVRELLDLERPLGILLVALLHFVPDDHQAHGLVETLRDAAAPGSFVVVSHGTQDNLSREQIEQSERIYKGSANPIRMRPHAEVVRFFEGLDIVEPGVVWVPLWRPEEADDLLLDQPEASQVYGAVGRKR